MCILGGSHAKSLAKRCSTPRAAAWTRSSGNLVGGLCTYGRNARELHGAGSWREGLAVEPCIGHALAFRRATAVHACPYCTDGEHEASHAIGIRLCVYCAAWLAGYGRVCATDVAWRRAGGAYRRDLYLSTARFHRLCFALGLARRTRAAAHSWELFCLAADNPTGNQHSCCIGGRLLCGFLERRFQRFTRSFALGIRDS